MRDLGTLTEHAEYLIRIERDLSMARMLVVQMHLERAMEIVNPRPQWAFFGSAVMVAHGIDIERSVGDVDVFINRPLYMMLGHQTKRWKSRKPVDDDLHRDDPPYLEMDIFGFKAHAFYEWRRREGEQPLVSAPRAIEMSEVVGGFRCVPLDFVRRAKMNALNHPEPREKDAKDLAAIDDYLAEQRKASA